MAEKFEDVVPIIPIPKEDDPTPAQKCAIETRDKTLLVSAAAGSGKTLTLTKRIIASILDDKNPVSIDEMLIVTFTKAATGELREKVERAIKKAIALNPQNARLAEQLRLLPSAKISTIDAFCGDILRQNCERVGVIPGYRIADEAEAALLGDTILEGLIEEIYRGRLPEIATAEEMNSLAECLTDTKHHAEVVAIIRDLHAGTKELKEGVLRIRALVEKYNPEKLGAIEETSFGRHAIELADEYAEHFRPMVESHLMANIGFTAKGSKSKERADVLTHDLLFLDRILAAKTFLEKRDVIIGVTLEDSKKISLTAEFKAVLPNTTAMRAELLDGHKSLKNIFFFGKDSWEKTYAGLYKTLMVLVRIIETFDEAFISEKKRLGICEFSDVSRFTYQCLWQDGERTEVAYSEMKKYKQIYVDEYQDVNAIQHGVFEAISTEESRFMVGDIKQSIYGFRGSDPEIFARLKDEFPKIDEAGDGKSASIFMSENFRCDEGVIDFTNAVFDRVFTVLAPSIGYQPEERLTFAKKYTEEEPKPDRRTPVVSLIPRGAKKGVFGEGEGNYAVEARYVAEKIAELRRHGKKNNGKEIEPGDIAIIMRSTSARLPSYIKALEDLGLPVASTDSGAFFLAPEILLMLAILNSIDNPERSIYLASAMMSPVFGFTADEVVRISKTTEGSLYRSLVAYVEAHPGYARGANFISFLRRYRTLAEGLSVDILISRLYRELGILTLAEGDAGRDCLNRLYEHARKFESSTFRGLYNFIHYINGIVDKKHSFDAKETNLSPDAVKIITSHSSKGLEFPVVFFSYLSSGIVSSKNERLIFDPEFGIAMKLRSTSGFTLINNPVVEILKSMISRREVEEEARILYVSLTRARERLYLVGTANKKIESIEEDIEAARDRFTPYTVYNMASYIEMVTKSALTPIMPPEKFLPDMSDELAEALDIIVPKRKEDSAENTDGAADDSINNRPENDTGADVGKENTADPDAELEVPDGSYRMMRHDFDIPEGDFEIPDGDIEWGDISPENRIAARTRKLVERFTYRYPREHLTRIPEKLSVSRLKPDILDVDTTEMSLEEIIEHQSHLNMERLPSFATGDSLTESAKRGIATHLLFQFCDFRELKEKGAVAELERLKAAEFISKQDADRVRIYEVEAFRRSALIDEIMSARKVWREQRFNVRLPASMITEDEELKAKLEGEKCEILVQGVIDCLYEDESGRLHLVDYKTDRLSPEERSDPALAEAKLRAAHSAQLAYYAEAVRRMFGRAPDTVEVYSLHLGRTVNVKID